MRDSRSSAAPLSGLATKLGARSCRSCALARLLSAEIFSGEVRNTGAASTVVCEFARLPGLMEHEWLQDIAAAVEESGRLSLY